MRLLAATVLAALGCAPSSNYTATTGGHPTGAGATSSGSGTSSTGGNGTTSGSTAEVSGTAIDTYVGDTTATNLPEDLSQTLIQALVPSASGGFTALPGMGTADGGFNIPAVPSGLFFLQEGAVYVYTSLRSFDLGVVHAGRANVVPTTVNPTNLIFNVTGLTPWQPYDRLELHATNNGDAVIDVEFSATNPPDAGATSLSDFTVNLDGYEGQHLLDSADGDSAFISHLCTTTAVPAALVCVLCDVFDAPPPFDEVDGQPLTFSGSFSQPGGQSLALSWGGSQLVSVGAAENTTAVASGSTLMVVAIPGGLGYGAYTSGADSTQGVNLVVAGLQNTDFDLGTVTYGNPFPATWGIFVQLRGSFSTTYTLPGAEALTYVLQDLVQYDATALPSGPLGPLVGPPTAPMINGQDALGNLSGVTTTPTITWAPPALGTATGYQVTIQWLRNQASLTTASDVADLYTDRTSLPLPPGILVSGQAYFLNIRAIDMPGVNLEESPYRLAFPRGFSDLSTGILTP